MPANKYALLRYRIIDKCLRSKHHPFPGKEDLRKACDEHLYGMGAGRVSASTIEKDLWSMRNEVELGFEAPIEYDARYRGYFYSDPNYTIDKVPLTDDDLNAIRFAANTLYQFRDIELFEQFGSAIDKLLDRLDFAPQVKSTGMQRYIQFEQAPEYHGSKWLGDLLEAVRKRQVVRFSYEKFGSKRGFLYEVEPLLLKEYRNRWYLIGWNRKKRQIATFGLERITAVELTGERFEPRKDFDPDRYFKHCFGITSGSGRPMFVHIRFEPLTAQYVKSQPLHKTQRIVEETEEGTVVEIEVYLTRELVMSIMSFGDAAHVLKPSALAEELKETHLKAASYYNSETGT